MTHAATPARSTSTASPSSIRRGTLRPYHKAQVGRTFSNLGQRRVLVIARDTTEARAWAAVPGVTHVSNQMTYKYPTAPPVWFKALYDR